MLYHYSDGLFEKLIPILGENPEDIHNPKACIWLTNRSDGCNGKPWKYVYIIDEKNINKEKIDEYDKVRICTNGNERWYRCFIPIDIFEQHKFNQIKA